MIKTIINQSFNLIIFIIIIATFNSSSAYGQNAESRNYSEVLNRLLSDSVFMYKTNLLGNQKDRKVFVILEKEYQVPGKISGFDIIQMDTKDAVCKNLKFGNSRTAIVLSPLVVLDSANRFVIPIASYEVEKIKGGCIWKVFGGGIELFPARNEFIFEFDVKTRKWQMVDYSR